MSSPLLLSFAVLLLIAVLISERASRTIISTAVLFLLAGIALGPGVLGVLDLRSGTPLVETLAELALFSVLFTDGMRVGLSDLRVAWRLPGRALLLGLPLTLLITAVLAHYLTGLPWLESFLLGAVLAPTDPVFASAIVGRDDVPGRLRHLLNVESGLNDGLALPIVLVLLAAAGGSRTQGWQLAEEIGLGIVVGVVIPLVVLTLERAPFLKATQQLRPLLTVSIGLLVLTVATTTHANLFLAAFAAGVTVVNYRPAFRAQDSTSRPSRDRAQRAIWSGPLPYFLSSWMASSRAARTTAAKSLRARCPCSKLNAEPSTKSRILSPFPPAVRPASSVRCCRIVSALEYAALPRLDMP